MKNYEGYIKTKLNKAKCRNSRDYLVLIPIRDDGGKLIGYLRPITYDYKESIPNCVALLSQWRMENPTISTGQFAVTEERTEKWLKKYVLENNSRIIFFIQDVKGTLLGHIGLASFNFETKTAELDSVLRGVKDNLPGLMRYAVNAIMLWGRDVLKIEQYNLLVFSDNKHAVRFYERCGFVKKRLIPLVRRQLPDEVKWEICDSADVKEAEKYYLLMELNKSAVRKEI